MLTLSTQQTTAPTWRRGSLSTRLATHQASRAPSEEATIPSTSPIPWPTSMLAGGEVEEDHRRQQHVEQQRRATRRAACAAPAGHRRSAQTPIATETTIAAAVSRTPTAGPFQSFK